MKVNAVRVFLIALLISSPALADSLSFPPKTGPLFLETEGGCDGSETLFG